jgi:ABC-type nitrate/sulfonate/bicarbonate transport system substrate-binding protein
MKLQKNRRTIIGIVLVTIAVLAVAGSLIYSYINSQNQSNLEQVSITDVQVVYSGLLYVAQNQGYFTQNGLNVSFPTYPTADAGLKALSNGSVDFAQAPEYSITQAILNGNQDLRIIATIEESTAVNLIARKDHGIENASDLIGKKIGLGAGTIREFYLGRYLNLNGLTTQNVTIVNLSLQNTVDAIANGSIDAAVMPDAIWVNKVTAELGDNAVVFPIQVGQPLFTVLVCTSQYLANNSQTVTKLLKALYQAEEYFINHSAEAQSIVMNRLNFTSADVGWSDHRFSLSLDLSLVTTMRDEAQWLITNNLTNQTQVPDFTQYVYTDALMSVKPDSVTIYK